MFSTRLVFFSAKKLRFFRKTFHYTRLRTDDTCSMNFDEEQEQHFLDLIISRGKRRKRAWIIGSVIAVVLIAVVIAVVVVFTTRGDDSENEDGGGGDEDESSKSSISLQDILENRLNPKNFNATWISGSELQYRGSLGNLVIYDIETKQKREIVPSTSPLLSSSFLQEISPSGRYMLFGFNYQKLYRYSYYAKYTVLDLQTQAETEISVEDGRNTHSTLQYAGWSPVGNSLVFVYGNNIYYKETPTSQEVKLTDDGQDGFVYNGIPDWVYEEEILSSNNAMWFSDDGKKLAYAKFNDSNVQIMTIPYYGTPGSLQSQYTRAVQVRYPKPGTPNPEVSLYVVDLTTRATVNLKVPNDIPQAILSAVSWATSEVLCAVWMNRVQNEAYITSYETSDNSLEVIRHLKEDKGWLDIFVPPIFSSDGSQLILILSQDQGGSTGGYRHITKLDRKQNSDMVALTSGKFVVTEILRWQQDMIYYEANTESDPGALHVYSYQISTNQIKCLSCDVQNGKGEKCLYNSAKFSDSGNFFVLNCAGPGVPCVNVYDLAGQKVLDWENNELLLEITDSVKLPLVKRFVFDTYDGNKAQVMLKLPPNVDLRGNTKYPMLVKVYGGPDSYQVDQKYVMDWGSYLAANKSIIYATIDGRGSGLKGDNLMFSLYRRLGTVEVEDQINVTKQIQQTVPYVDPTRTAIWGWSYGGYAAGMALATDEENIFKCGMSVAPVTDWTLYDSLYTERFMGLPTENDNSQGYEDAKLLNKYARLKNKSYFLIHGTFDDNVHYQQSMLWSKVLERQDILFRQQSYPDEDHGLAAVRPHLYHSLEHFLDECFIENV